MASSTFFAPEPTPMSPCAVKCTVPPGPGCGEDGRDEPDGDGWGVSEGDGGGGFGRRPWRAGAQEHPPRQRACREVEFRALPRRSGHVASRDLMNAASINP